MTSNNLMLVAQLSGLRILVLANRFGCDTDLARNVHDGLAAKLAQMIDAQRKVLAAERALTMARGTANEEDAFYDLHHYHMAYYETWLVEPVALLDDYLVDDLTQEYFDFRTGNWHHRDSEVPFNIPVPVEKLCGLGEIIAKVEDISGARFNAERVCYSEPEAETAWWAITGKDPATVFEMKAGGSD